MDSISHSPNPYYQYLSYIAFAVIAIIINTGSQAMTVFFLTQFIPSIANYVFSFAGIVVEGWFGAALVVGTVTGFIFKFFVDKWVVFRDRLAHDEQLAAVGKQITKYFGFAILTTLIFWGCEGVFYLWNKEWYLVGGVMGLAIGYTIKFFLDRTFVFTVPPTSEH